MNPLFPRREGLIGLAPAPTVLPTQDSGPRQAQALRQPTHGMIQPGIPMMVTENRDQTVTLLRRVEQLRQGILRMSTLLAIRPSLQLVSQIAEKSMTSATSCCCGVPRCRF